MTETLETQIWKEEKNMENNSVPFDRKLNCWTRLQTYSTKIYALTPAT